LFVRQPSDIEGQEAVDNYLERIEGEGKECLMVEVCLSD
jgi:hypothetical protein